MINYVYSIENSQINKQFYGQTFISNDFILVIYEFLKNIYENILILHSHNVFTIDISHMYIKKMLLHKFSYILYEIIYFNINECFFYTNNKINQIVKINLPNVYGITNLLSEIKKIILNKNHNLNHCKLNTPNNNNIKIINDNDKNFVQCNEFVKNDNLKYNNKKIIKNKVCNADKINFPVEKEKIQNEIHKQSNSIDPTIIIEKNKIKNKEKLLEEKNNEKKRIFASDLSVYKKIKNDLENKTINEIPPLFLDKYFIFKLLDEDNLLNSENNYLLFLAMYESDNNSDNEKNNDVDFGIKNPEKISSKNEIEMVNNIKSEKETIQFPDVNNIDIKAKTKKNKNNITNNENIIDENEFDNNIDASNILDDNFIKKTSFNNFMLNTNDNNYGIF